VPRDESAPDHVDARSRFVREGVPAAHRLSVSLQGLRDGAVRRSAERHGGRRGGAAKAGGGKGIGARPPTTSVVGRPRVWPRSLIASGPEWTGRTYELTTL